MHFNTYVINLKKDTAKWNAMKQKFKNTDIRLIRFNAIHGRDVSDEILRNNVSTFCRYFCPHAVIGCGLSHILLAGYFLEHDANDFCLILEDDVTPLYSDLKDKIHECLDEMKNKKWDIIKFYCNGFCGYDKNKIVEPNRYLTGGNGAYILSKQGAKSINEMKLTTHVDMHYNYSPLLIYLNKYPLFTSHVDNSTTSDSHPVTKYLFDYKINEYSPPIYWYLGEKIYHIPYFDFNITSCHIVIFVLCGLFILAYYLVRG
jgi:GR25 family glycosyltransferase involved in LPS biosynthesis